MASDTSEPGTSSHAPQQTKRTRRRIPVSCTLCHTRKLKCDRQKPCSSCQMRGEAPKCNYISKIADGQTSGSKRRRPAIKDEELQRRLDNLERLIVEAASGKPEAGSASTGEFNDRNHGSASTSLSFRSDVPDARSVGYLDRKGPNAVYAGDTSFHGILQEVVL